MYHFNKTSNFHFEEHIPPIHESFGGGVSYKYQQYHILFLLNCYILQTEVQRGPHYFGAGLAFFLGGIYCVLQTLLSYKVLYKFRGEKILLILQIINSIILWLMLVLCILLKYRYRHMGRVVRKPVFGVFDQHKPGCTATENGWSLEITNSGRICVAKSNALLSCS